MIRRRQRAIAGLLLLGVLGSGLVAWRLNLLTWLRLPCMVREVLPRGEMAQAEYELWARQQFYRRFPNEQPLNWRIAHWARRYYDTRPMGTFVLHTNDCSDFVDCLVDDALGPKASFRRNSDTHIVARTRGVMKSFPWEPGMVVIPGDIVSVEHSPWYPPKEPTNIWHVGVVGPDGHVYDFVKLRSWPKARYGRNSVQWFIRHCPAPDEVVITRLRPEYRFRSKALPFSQ